MKENLHKKLFFLIGIILLMTFVGTANAKSKMTIKIELLQKHVKISMAGAGKARIDWGDGKSNNLVLLPSNTEYCHDYDVHVDLSDPIFGYLPSYTITISGKNVTGLYLQGNLNYPGSSYDIYDTEIQCLELDVSHNRVLMDLYCPGQYFENLDVSKNIALVKLDCWGNQLTTLDVSKNTALKELSCGLNQLTELDVNNNIALEELFCDDNEITNLDISKNKNLEWLTCENSRITSLDISKNAALIILDCSNNELTNLDVSNNPLLRQLYCTHNFLTTLDVRNNTELNHLECESNYLSETALNILFGTLHDKKNVWMDMFKDKYIYVDDNVGSKSCDKSIAENKGWKVSVK